MGGILRRLGTNQRFLIATLLLLLPLLVYSNTIFSRFGFRDDYSILREVNEEPGKIIKLCSSHARPLYGWMLETFFSHMDQIDDLWAGRAVGALCIGGIAVLLYLVLRRLGWSSVWSALFAALMSMLPAAQVDVSWAICWPHVVGGLFGITGFLAANQGKMLRRLVGIMLVTAGALIYQPNSLFYLVPVAAGLVMMENEPLSRRIRWLSGHLVIVGSALIAAFMIIQCLYAAGLIRLHPLVAIETEPLEKLSFFIRTPLANALALFVLNDMREGSSLVYLLIVLLVGMTILAGGWGEIHRKGWREGAFWAGSFIVLCIGASAPSLIAALRWPTYRTIFPLTGVCLVFFVFGLHHLNQLFTRRSNWLVPAALSAMITLAAPLASWNAYTLFALPQQQELAMIEEGVKRLKPKAQWTVFVIRPDPEDAPAPAYYSDEFGSLSTDSDWAAKEMFKLVLRERFPYLQDLYMQINFLCGHRLPLRAKCDLIIDMRRLKDFREHLAAEGYLLF